MDKTQIIIFIAAIFFLAFRLYQKYFKKGRDKSSAPSKTVSDSGLHSTSKDDDYEPYSKR
jgi:hypothetical protein